PIDALPQVSGERLDVVDASTQGIDRGGIIIDPHEQGEDGAWHGIPYPRFRMATMATSRKEWDPRPIQQIGCDPEARRFWGKRHRFASHCRIGPGEQPRSKDGCHFGTLWTAS